ncbi:MAG: polysaccharide deacetylase family protein [Melioribacteraceae bacterium]
MTRIIKLILSSFYFIWLRTKRFIQSIFGFDVRPICVALYYHSIFENEKDAFAKQMNLISRKCKVIKTDFFGELEKNKLHTIITFDDGFENLVNNAVPILEEKKLPFTIFFISDYFGKTPNWEFEGVHPDMNEIIMTVEQMNKLPKELVTIGSHSVSHNMLTSHLEEDLVYELEKSKKKLEELSGRKIDTIAFPNGEYNNFIVQKSFAAGYKRVFTIEPKLALSNSNEKITGRVWANGDDWYPEFWLKIHGAYSWLDKAFEIKKSITK